MVRTLYRMSLGVGLLLLLLEVLFRILPVSGATAVDYLIDPQILTYPPNHRFTMSTGWDLRNAQHLQANNAGFVADLDFVPDPRAVALIGDSHIEAVSLPARDRPAAQLQALLGPQRPVYALGSPGTSLLDHAERVRLAAQRWGVEDMVVLVDVGDIRQSLCGSGQVASPCVDQATGQPSEDRRPAPTWVRRLLRNSAVLQYLLGQIKVSLDELGPALRDLPATLVPGRRAPPPRRPAPLDESPRMQARLQAVGQLFFDRIRPYVRGRLVVLINRPARGSDTSALPLADSDRFAELARHEGATVIDLGDRYADHRRRSPLALVIGPYDGHENALGTALIAQAAAEGLRVSGRWRPSAP